MHNYACRTLKKVKKKQEIKKIGKGQDEGRSRRESRWSREGK
jgi:hypothetical protein